MDFKNYENKFKDKRCFILGNAPNLLQEDLSLLRGEQVFVTNRGYKARDYGLDHFDYVVVCDPLVYTDYCNELSGLEEGVRFYPDWFEKLDSYKGESFVPLFYRTHWSEKYFNNDMKYKSRPKVLLRWPQTYWDGWGKAGNAVLNTCLIAYFMGFSEIYLLGVEMIYRKGDTHFYKDVSRRENQVQHGHKSKAFDYIPEFVKFFKRENLKFVNLTETFPYKHMMDTDSLQNIIKGS